MRPLIGFAASAALIAGRNAVLGGVDLVARRRRRRRRSPRARLRCRRGRPARSRRSCARPLRTRGTTGGVERMDRGDRRAVERGIQLAPFARRHHRARRPGPAAPASCRCRPGSAGNISPSSVTVGLSLRAAARRLHRPLLGFVARVLQHRAGQHVLGLGMGRHAEARHVDADDAHAVDLLRQQLQRHAATRSARRGW